MDINNEFIKKYENLIYGLIKQAGVKDYDAYQELKGLVVIRILEHNNYDESKGAVTTWLTYLVRSVISNYIKASTRSTDVLDSHIVPIDEVKHLIDESADHADERAELRELLKNSSISPFAKQVLKSHLLYGDTYKEIAEYHKVSYENVRKLASRAVIKLKEEYDEQEASNEG